MYPEQHYKKYSKQEIIIKKTPKTRNKQNLIKYERQVMRPSIQESHTNKAGPLRP